VTIRSIQSFENLSKRTRLQLQVEVEGPDVLVRLAGAVADHKGGNGQLRLRAKLEAGEVELVLGRDFHLDAELAARIERLDGVTSVRLSVAEPPRLALVS
jgi:DNA polymerase-3 subunit alpha